VAKKEWNFKKVFKKCKFEKNCQAKERPTNFKTIKLEKKNNPLELERKKKKKKKNNKNNRHTYYSLLSLG